MKFIKSSAAVFVCLSQFILFDSLLSAAPMPKETEVIGRLSVNGTDRQLGMGISIFPPNSEKPNHRAIGPEIVYVIEGEVTLVVEGKAPQVISAGQSYSVAADDTHTTKAGPRGAKTIASWVTVPGKEFNIYQ